MRCYSAGDQLLPCGAREGRSPTTRKPSNRGPPRTRVGPTVGDRRLAKIRVAQLYARDLEAAIGLLLTAPEAQPLLPPERAPHADDLIAHQQLTARLTTYLAHRRGIRVTLWTTLVVVPTIALALILLLR
ncbi:MULTISPECIES: hypothetical protein [unclassified Actinoplanes]|uniref:hypothetical protein n=1 Tax=unclassified Actinoplanes TaxID=2626549 RepID=UPI00043A2B9F|nr:MULTISPECIES: hypothetical protein [unclassified Actinoplanes]